MVEIASYLAKDKASFSRDPGMQTSTPEASHTLGENTASQSITGKATGSDGRSSDLKLWVRGDCWLASLDGEKYRPEE